MALLTVKNLSFNYAGSEKKALDKVSFSLEAGQFTLLCGLSGSGKSTLLRLLKEEMIPKGNLEGEILFGREHQASPFMVGYVQQNTQNQAVTDKVWHELAFGLENMNLPTAVIQAKVAEISHYFGMESWLHEKVEELSGGQRQLLNLASVLITEPSLLLLDEPTSQLDPIAGEDFLLTLKRIHEELGLSILLIEHRMERVLSLCDDVLLLDEGRLSLHSKAKEFPRDLVMLREDHPMKSSLPGAARLALALGEREEVPLHIREGKKFLKDKKPGNFSPPNTLSTKEIILEAKDIWFRYEKESPDLMKGLSFALREGEIYAFLGGNGCGKTTLLKILSKQLYPYRGKVKLFGKDLKKMKAKEIYQGALAHLPQDPTLVFVKDELMGDLLEVAEKEQVLAMLYRFGLEDLAKRNPFDLSGGEVQKAALAKALLAKPRILLLDEPSKGMDAKSKEDLIDFLLLLREEGLSMIIVSHDVEFAASLAQGCSLFFDARLLEKKTPHDFFSHNTYYTTSISRLVRDKLPQAITLEEASVAFGARS